MNTDIPLTNLHTHTFRCKHASGTVDEYCAEAVKQEIRILGFSDHSPFPDGRNGSSRMEFSELPDYVRDVREAKRKFPQLTILLGSEIDFFEDLGVAYYEDLFFGEYRFDYLIGGVHWISNEQDYRNADGTLTLEGVRRYMKCAIRLMETGLIRYLAHPDLTAFRTPFWTPEIAALYREVMEASASLGVPVEINAYGMRKPRTLLPDGSTRMMYPWDPVWELAAECGVKAVAGSDAHRPQDVRGNIGDCFRFAEKHGLAIHNYDVAREILASPGMLKKN